MQLADHCNRYGWCVYVYYSNLVVRQGKPEDIVADLIKQLGSVSTVAFQEEVIFPYLIFQVRD